MHQHPTQTQLPLPAQPRPATEAERRQARAERRTTGSGRPTPVPLSVWLTTPPTGCCSTCEQPEHACAQRLPQDLADQLVAAYSRPGDLVYVPDAGNAQLVIAAARTGRRVLAYAHSANHARVAQEAMREQATEVSSLTVLRRSEPRNLPGQAERTRPRAALAVLAPHLPADPRDLAALAEACARMLGPGGVLAICSRQNSGLDMAGHLVTYGQAAGLVYLQHIAAVEAAADGERLVAVQGEPTGHGPDCACQHPGASAPGWHRLAHSDVIILRRP
ncbi:hypothetical protein ABIA33_001374 [Streptacidiphilus sp. MAP12-16]|uniref:hypothetical protein n=1 Tax=Streptacidiphilus sp. MAP12-16 TaxID=3156300 RepID=UPI003510DF69